MDSFVLLRRTSLTAFADAVDRLRSGKGGQILSVFSRASLARKDDIEGIRDAEGFMLFDNGVEGSVDTGTRGYVPIIYAVP